MIGPGDGLLKPEQAVQRAYGGNTRWLLTFFLCTFAVTAIIAVIVASAMGQPTVALIIGLVSGAFFAGMLC